MWGGRCEHKNMTSFQWFTGLVYLCNAGCLCVCSLSRSILYRISYRIINGIFNWGFFSIDFIPSHPISLKSPFFQFYFILQVVKFKTPCSFQSNLVLLISIYVEISIGHMSNENAIFQFGQSQPLTLCTPRIMFVCATLACIQIIGRTMAAIHCVSFIPAYGDGEYGNVI